MRRLPLWFVLTLLLPLPLVIYGQAPTIAPGATAGEKPLYANTYALLIGIDAYQHVHPLHYAVSDVRALREVLVTLYGFPAEHVTVLTDAEATKEGITRALAELANNRRIGPEDRVLIYFSGHGQTVPAGDGMKGFLIPVDARVELANPTNPAPYLTSCLPMNLVWETLELCPAKHVLLIADACYSGLMARSRAPDEPAPDTSARVLAGKRARQR